MADISTLKSANPYVSQPYKKTGWQNFLSSLGFRTESDAWSENMAVQAAEYDAALAQKEYDQQYNEEMYNKYQSPQAQVAQMRAAGLNPDLSPSSIDSGNALEAPPMGEDPSTPMQSTGEEGVILGFADKVLSAFSTCLGLTNGIQGVVSNRLKNRLLGLQVDKEDTETGLSIAESLFPSTLPNSPESVLNEDGTEESWIVGAMNRADILTNGMPKKMRRKVMNNLRAFWNSAPKTSEAWSEWSKNVKNQKEYYSESNEFYSADSRVMHSIYEHLGRAREQVEQLKIRSAGQEESANIAENENREDIAKGLDIDSAIRAENASNEAKYDDAKIRAILRGTIKDILSDLDKNTSPFAEVFKTLLSVLSFQYL